MCRQISKRRGNGRYERVDDAQLRQPIDKNSQAERNIVLNIFTELAQAGLGVLDEIPDLGSEFFTLRSGEVFWLGANEITRIR